MPRRSSLTVTLVLITSPVVLAGCGRRYDDGNVPRSGGGGFHFTGGGSFRRGGAFRSGGTFRGGGVGHASPAGGFGGFGHAGS